MTDNQYDWIKTNVLKLNRNSEAKKRVLSSHYYGTNENNLDALVKKLENLRANFNRNDIRFILKLLAPSLKALESIVLPEYKKRSEKDKNKYRKYLTQTEERIIMLTELKNELESKL